MSVAFVFTNPKHHLEMMHPVARVLEERGIACRLVSLAELRGFDTPRDLPGLQRAVPLNVRRHSVRPDAAGTSTKVAGGLGRVARNLVWQPLRLRLRYLLRGARTIVVPNDAVYPYSELLEDVQHRGVRSVLLQEGIRFPLPGGYVGPTYGGGGTNLICAWGEGSRDYFIASSVPEQTIVVTGAPRLDELDPAAWTARGQQLRQHLSLATAPIAFLSNPIENQGYGSKLKKLELFASFLAEAAPLVRTRNLPIVVKNHLHEDPADYARVATASSIKDLVTVLDRQTPIFAVIAAARAAVVLTSTVGLEALTFGLPLGVLEIPRHDFAFEYVQRGAATPLRLGSIGSSLDELLAEPPTRRETGAAFVARHLHDRGRARYNVADAVERVWRA